MHFIYIMKESTIIDTILTPLDFDEEGWEIIQQQGINHVYPSGMTALGLAVYYEQEDNVHFLLKKGTDPNIFGEGANPPLLDSYISYSPRLFILLLMYGANHELEEKASSFKSLKEMMEEMSATDFLDTLFNSSTRE